MAFTIFPQAAEWWGLVGWLVNRGLGGIWGKKLGMEGV